MANEADETPEEIVEHLAELGFNPQDDGLDDVLEETTMGLLLPGAFDLNNI